MEKSRRALGAKVRFLLGRKFPNWQEVEEQYDDARTPRERREVGANLSAIDDYVRGLKSLPTAVLDGFYQHELSLVDAEQRQSLQEKQRFIDCEDDAAKAELTHWMALETWSASEAASLSLGRDPRVVAERRATKQPRSNFRRAYDARTAQIQRAQQAGSLKEFITPTALLKWLQTHAHSYPEELETTIVATPAFRKAERSAEELALQVTELTKEKVRLDRELTDERIRKDSRKNYLKTILGLILYGNNKEFEEKFVPDKLYTHFVTAVLNELQLVGQGLDRETLSTRFDEAINLLDQEMRSDLVERFGKSDRPIGKSQIAS